MLIASEISEHAARLQAGCTRGAHWSSSSTGRCEQPLQLERDMLGEGAAEDLVHVAAHPVGAAHHLLHAQYFWRLHHGSRDECLHACWSKASWRKDERPQRSAIYAHMRRCLANEIQCMQSSRHEWGEHLQAICKGQ